MVARRLVCCVVPKVCLLPHCICVCSLAFSPPYHHVGGIKQAGNVGTAVWWAMTFCGVGALGSHLSCRSFALALHAFRLLFLRSRVTRQISWLALTLGWFFVAIIVSIGPLALQTEDRGPYFGPSGYWYVALLPYANAALPINPRRRCWITHEYPLEQTLLEYAIVGPNGGRIPTHAPMLLK